MDKNTFASKYDEWQPKYNWDTCKTGREEYGKFLCSFLTESSEGLVVNLNGTWGTGKTELLRRLYVELAENNHPVVYIDAWKSDFLNQPLSVLCSELLNQIGHIFDNRAPNGKKDKKEEAWKKYESLRAYFSVGLKVLSNSTSLYLSPEDSTIVKAGAESLNVLVEKLSVPSSKKNKYKSLVDSASKKHVESMDAMNEIKEHLYLLSEFLKEIYELEMPIVILVDELDRCRPTYAIEMLEVIKHFFETKGCVFLVATDTNALQHSIKSVYGAGFESENYLRRFFDRKVSLPKVSILDYLNSNNLNFDKYENLGIKLYPFTENQRHNIHIFSDLFESNGLELRDVDQILQRFFASLDFVANNLDGKIQVMNSLVLIAGIIEHFLESDSFYIRSNTGKVAFGLRFNNKNKDYSLVDFLSRMLDTTTLDIPSYIHRGSVRIANHNKEKVLSVQSTEHSNLSIPGYLVTTKTVEELIEHSALQGTLKYWLWDDYKNIISLSGYIQ